MENKELNQEEMQKAAGGKGPDLTELLANNGYCLKHGHEYQYYNNQLFPEKDLYVTKYFCRMCGKRGFVKKDVHGPGNWIEISESEYNALRNS